MRLCAEQLNDLAPLSLFRFWLGCITNTTRYDFDFLIREPGPLVDLYLGTLSRESISVAPLLNSDGKAQRRRTCELAFYLATLDMEEGLQEQAQRHLQASADTCAVGGIEFIAARAMVAEINLKR
jgi:hypothetical protein